jgi:hypothetical protein
LLSASLTANYTGDHADWRHLTTLIGRDKLLRLDRHACSADARSALEVLRLAGDEDGLKSAVRHLVIDGPAIAVTLAASEVRLESATRTTGPADLTLLQHGGDVLDEETADRTVTWLLATLDDPSTFASRTTPSFWLDLRVIEVLGATAPATSATMTVKVVNRIADLPAQSDQALATAWSRIVDVLPKSVWTQDIAPRLYQAAQAHHDALRLALLKAIAPLSEEARDQLHEEARSGSVAALAELGDVRNLTPDIVSTAVASLHEAIEQRVEEAQNGRFEFGPDVGHALALLNVWHPPLASWEPLEKLLSEDSVPGGYKVGAFHVLAALPDRIPDDIKHRLGVIATEVSGKPPRQNDLPQPIGGDAAGAAANLAVALGVFDAQSTAGAILKLLAGDHGQHRWAARTAKSLGTPQGIGILAALAESADAYVRATASSNLASLVAAGDGDAFAAASLHRSVNDPGTLVASSIARTIAGSPTLSDEALGLLRALSSHSSAQVRMTVTEVLGR